MGFTTGMSVVISQLYGAKDYTRLKRAFSTSAIFSLGLSVVLGIAGILVIKPLLTHLLQTPAEIFADSYTYLFITFLGYPFTLMYNMYAAVLRAVGDSKTPLYFLILLPYAVLNMAMLLGNMLALLMVGLVFIAVGIFASSLTENQLSAAVGSIGIILAFLIVGLLGAYFPQDYWFRFVLDALSVFTRYEYFSYGYFDLATVVYYFSVCAVFLYLTIRTFDRRRYN